MTDEERDKHYQKFLKSKELMNQGRIANGNMDSKTTAEWLIKRLKKRGFIVQRYDAIKTKSIYLKLDYGVANSIRISDHKGYRYLSYRYNVECWRECGKRQGRDKKGYDRFYYASCKDDMKQLLEDVKANKAERLERWGEDRYKEFMEKNIEQGKQAREHTFWHKAKEI